MQYRFGGCIRGSVDGHGSAAQTGSATGSISSITATVVIVVIVVLYQGGIFLIVQETIVLGGRL